MEYPTFEDLKGVTLEKIDVNHELDEITFVSVTGEQYKLYHEQDCCESVTIEDIAGDLDDLIGSPITNASEVEGEYALTPEEEVDHYAESETWTFYKIGTNKGSVTIRWYGSSNGYYSESVSFTKINPTVH